MSAWTSADGAMRVDGILYVTTRPLEWRVGTIDGPLYVVPAGFRFEVSVPAIFRAVFDPHDRACHTAACLHDHMHQSGWSRLTSAGEFYAALKADGVGRWMRAAMFAAVAFTHF